MEGIFELSIAAVCTEDCSPFSTRLAAYQYPRLDATEMDDDDDAANAWVVMGHARGE
jgi:hypothetical protein